MHAISDAERRTRLGLRHCLASGAASATVAGAAEAVVALHATDPATVFMSAAARTSGLAVPLIEDALYVRRSVVRMLGMRRTVFVTPAPLVPVVQAGATAAVAAKERAKLLTFLSNSGFESPERWLRDVSGSTLAALEARGEAGAAELATDVPELARKITVGQGKWVAEQGASTRVLFLLSAEGHVVRGRPKGSWTSTQYRWAPTTSWLPDGVPTIAPESARESLARAWLRAYGPGTAGDLKWWTGWTMAETRRALAALPVTEVALDDGTTGYVLSDDLEPVPAPSPWVALLPALDPTPMGWTARDWFLGPHRDALFDRAGNVGPTIWNAGRVVGGWAQRRTGEVVTHLLEDVGKEASAAVTKAAAELTAWLGPARITPRFRTPLERELSG